MIKLCVPLLFCVSVSVAQYAPVDVFPLKVNNQWTYSYGYEYRDETGQSAEYQWSDTGTVDLAIIDSTVTVDSTRWCVQETGSHWTRYNTMAWSGPSIQIDTFEIIENNHGDHRLYRTGDADEIYKSVLPFLPSLVDSPKIWRYAVVDTSGLTTIHTRDSLTGRTFSFTFKQGVGLLSVAMGDGCLCLTYYWTAHTLRSSNITAINSFREDVLAKSYHLDQNYPNPFNPSTTFSFTLPSRSFVSLKVFDLIGREVENLLSEEMQAGKHYRRWNASEFPSGIYFYRIQAGSFSETRKLVLLK
jgi:hypothetical protein